MTGGARGQAAGFAAAHARLLRDTRFQFDFPVWRAPATVPPPPWLAAALRMLATGIGYAFWAILLAGGAVLLFLLGRELMRVGDAGRIRPVVLAGEVAPLAAARMRTRLAQADRLAEQGRFGEAVRLLLFRTLEDVEERRPGLVGPALTSREILRLEALPAGGRAALARIAAVVEQVVFAGQETDAAAFAACRDAYARFVEQA